MLKNAKTKGKKCRHNMKVTPYVIHDVKDKIQGTKVSSTICHTNKDPQIKTL